jgi:hypothetical protein
MKYLVGFILFLVSLSLNVVHGIEVVGYLADNLCIDKVIALDGANMRTSPQDHTVHCLLIARCIDSGFAILVNKGTTESPNYEVEYELTDDGNDVAVAYLQQLSESQNNIYVNVTGNLVGSKLNAIEIKASAEPSFSESGEGKVISQSEKYAIGFVVGTLSFAAVVGLLYYIQTAKEDPLVLYGPWIESIPVIVAVGAAITAVVLLSNWDPHPFFMSLFLFAQVQAIANWTIFTPVLTAKTAHVIVQCGALIMMSVALAAIVKDNHDSKSPALTTMHSWVGVAAISLFCFNFLLGSAMGYCKVFCPDLTLIRRLKPLNIHKFLGGGALALSAAALVAGVMNELPQGACWGSVPLGMVDHDPGEHYDQLPPECMQGGGAGIAVLVAGLSAVLAVLVRRGMRANLFRSALVSPVGTTTAGAAGASGVNDDGSGGGLTGRGDKAAELVTYAAVDVTGGALDA